MNFYLSHDVNNVFPEMVILVQLTFHSGPDWNIYLIAMRFCTDLNNRTMVKPSDFSDCLTFLLLPLVTPKF